MLRDFLKELLHPGKNCQFYSYYLQIYKILQANFEIPRTLHHLMSTIRRVPMEIIREDDRLSHLNQLTLTLSCALLNIAWVTELVYRILYLSYLLLRILQAKRTSNNFSVKKKYYFFFIIFFLTPINNISMIQTISKVYFNYFQKSLQLGINF